MNVTTDLVQQNATLERSTQRKYLWEFMTHSNPAIAPVQQRSLKRYLECGDQIRKELGESKTYPWALLASIAAPKFFSDIVESVLGAVYIDSGANLEICTQVLEMLGLTTLLRRLVEEPDMVLDQSKTLLWQARAKAGLPALKVVSRSREEVDGQKYYCQLLLEGEVYAEVADAWCEEEAMLRACEIGLERFRRERDGNNVSEEDVDTSRLGLDDEGGELKRKREHSSPKGLSSSGTGSDEE